MGFEDRSLNQRLLVQHSGSLKQTVKELRTADRAAMKKAARRFAAVLAWAARVAWRRLRGLRLAVGGAETAGQLADSRETRAAGGGAVGRIT